jgi:hypothetical protein
MTRQHLSDILTPLLVQETNANQTEATNVLAKYSTAELHRQFYKAVNAGKLNLDGTLRTRGSRL